ncbi:MAG: MlaD family protein [Proteobacteria bacterium]|nr:MlaD family protein [Pseudomonadota bacterium]
MHARAAARDRRSRTPIGLGRGVWLGLAVLGLVGARCGPPPFELWVTLPDAQGLEVGSEVQYAGIAVGQVEGMSIHQPEPTRAGAVRLLVAIDDPALTLRQGDRFRVVPGGLFSDARLQILPGDEEALPLERGAIVAGEPPTTFDQMADDLRDRLSKLLEPDDEDDAESLLDQLMNAFAGEEGTTPVEPTPEPGR